MFVILNNVFQQGFKYVVNDVLFYLYFYVFVVDIHLNNVCWNFFYAYFKFHVFHAFYVQMKAHTMALPCVELTKTWLI